MRLKRLAKLEVGSSAGYNLEQRLSLWDGAGFIWPEADADGRNVYVAFHLVLEPVPACGEAHARWR